MRFLSKITFICNCCFVIAVCWLRLEATGIANDPYNGIMELNPVQSTAALLGYGAILLNIAFFIGLIYRHIVRKPKQVPVWLILVNLVFIPIQLFYFLF